MVLRSLPIAAAAIALTHTALTAAPAAAADDYVAINAGVAGVVTGKRSAEFGLEYRGAPLVWKLYPHVGGYVTHRGAAYGYAGFGLEFRLLPQVLFRANTAVGAYGQGDDIDLGHVIEFRSGLELAYEFPNKSQVGLTFHHLSNAGLDDRNPGTEIATITYSVPLDKLF
jgi:lipid A 3-O-deacylase